MSSGVDSWNSSGCLMHRRRHKRGRICRGEVLAADGEAEGRPLPYCAVGPDIPVIRLDDALHAGKADALTGDVSHPCVGAATKDIEYSGEIVNRDSDPGVANEKFSARRR